MDLSELQAVIRRDRKRVDDLGRLAGLVEVLAQSAGVPVEVQADDARIVVTLDVSGLQSGPVTVFPCPLAKVVPPLVLERPLPSVGTWQPPEPVTSVMVSAPELVTGPITDAERAVVRDMVAAGATGKDIGKRLNRDPRQLGGVIGAIRKAEQDNAPRKRVLTPPVRQPAPEPASEAAPVAQAVEPEPVRIEPVANVLPVDPDVAPFAGDLPSDARVAQEWDARVAAVKETVLFSRALDLDLMTSLSAGMAAKDFALTRELTPAEVAGRFAALMGDAKRTMENQGHCVAALKRAVWAD